MFCGWDWGSTHHGVCVIDDDGAVVGRWLIEHTESALARLFIELGELDRGDDVADRDRTRRGADRRG